MRVGSSGGEVGASLWVIVLVVTGLGCSLDWDSLDPRGADGGSSPSTSSSSSSSSGLGGEGASSSTSSVGGAGGASTGMGGDGAVGGSGGRLPTFFDDFDRPDAAALGNGWVEKTPDAFELIGNEVVKLTTTTNNYRNHLVYRPASEALVDVEASVEATFNSVPPAGAQIFARAPNPGVEVDDSYDGYLLFLGFSGESIIYRQEGSTIGTSLATLSLSRGLTVTDRYRLTVRVEGTAPVIITGRIERLDGSSWTVIGEETVQDGSAEAITVPGVAGFTVGSSSALLQYDNFTLQAL